MSMQHILDSIHRRWSVMRINAGVNVAAFLLMDSQKDSSSPGHHKSAQPAQGKPQITSLPHPSDACQSTLAIYLFTPDCLKYKFDHGAVYKKQVHVF